MQQRFRAELLDQQVDIGKVGVSALPKRASSLRPASSTGASVGPRTVRVGAACGGESRRGRQEPRRPPVGPASGRTSDCPGSSRRRDRVAPGRRRAPASHRFTDVVGLEAKMSRSSVGRVMSSQARRAAPPATRKPSDVSRSKKIGATSICSGGRASGCTIRRLPLRAVR